VKSEIIEIFDWLDIEKEICNEMGISEDHFNYYHEVVGGYQKNLWFEWMAFFDENTANDQIKFKNMNSLESDLEKCSDNSKNWLEPFIRAVHKIWLDNNIQYIKYSW
jgi:Fe-S-cluster formation regulator IscX/YfhJ